MQNKKTLFLVAVLLVVSISAFLIFKIISDKSKTARFTIAVAPKSSIIALNGIRTKAGVTKVEPGKYYITIKKTGFKSYENTIDVNKNDNKNVAVVLESNSKDTANWYNTHPEDQKIAEKISSFNFDERETTNSTQSPILSQLPFIGPGSYYRIDYSDTDKNGRLNLSITLDSEEYKEDALSWIKSQGFNPEDYNIQYIFSNNEDNL